MASLSAKEKGTAALWRAAPLLLILILGLLSHKYWLRVANF